MKVKTSITLSEDVRKEIERILPDSTSRSTFIEKAIRNFLMQKRREQQEKKDMEIINQVAKRLNKEASDVLSYQVELWNEAIYTTSSRDLRRIQSDLEYLLLWVVGSWLTQNFLLWFVLPYIVLTIVYQHK